MSRIVRTTLLGVLFVAFSILPVRRAEACSVCLAGDPIFDTQGTTVQQPGDFSIFFQARGWTKKSGHPPGEAGDHHEEDTSKGVGVLEHRDEHAGDEGHAEDDFERNDSQRLDLFLSWTPTDRITLTLDLPWAFNKVVEVAGDERATSKLAGFSDMSVAASGSLWRNRDVLPSTSVEARAFLKFPTGKSKQKVNGVRDPHLQVGTGSWDFGFGLAGVHRLTWASLYSSLFYRVNTKGSLDYEYGDVFLANAAVEVPLGHALELETLNPVTAGLELNFRWSDFDDFHGRRFEDSGGSLLYVTPSLRVKLPGPWPGNAPALRAAVQVPATSSWLHGFQREGPVWFVGMQYTF